MATIAQAAQRPAPSRPSASEHPQDDARGPGAGVPEAGAPEGGEPEPTPDGPLSRPAPASTLHGPPQASVDAKFWQNSVNAGPHCEALAVASHAKGPATRGAQAIGPHSPVTSCIRVAKVAPSSVDTPRTKPLLAWSEHAQSSVPRVARHCTSMEEFLRKLAAPRVPTKSPDSSVPALPA